MKKSGCLGAQSLVQQLRNTSIYLPQQTLIGEPTSMNICRMHGGHTTIDIRIQRNSSTQQQTTLGLFRDSHLAEIIQSLQQYQILLEENPCSHPEMCGAHSLINIAEVQGGSAINIIPEHAHVRIGVRPMPEHSEDEIIADFYERIELIQKKYSNAKNYHDHSPKCTCDDHIISKSATAKLFRLLPQSQSIGVPFATDGGRLQDVNLEPIVCGPGSIDVAHKANEYVCFDDLQQSFQIQKRLIQGCL